MIGSVLVSGRDRIGELIDAGGPIVVIMLVMSVIAGAVVIAKIWQFRREGLGRHAASRHALAAWAQGREGEAISILSRRHSHLATILRDTMEARLRGTPPEAMRERVLVRAELGFGRLQKGLRALDAIAQTAPLLGLFGTVVGMIDAFRAVQGAGSQVDPATLAGGIWVALITTAVGLGVAMPTSLVLTWLEARIANERTVTDEAIEEVLTPGLLTRATIADAA